MPALNIAKLELIDTHKWLKSVVEHVKAIYCKKLKGGKAMIRMKLDFRGNEIDVSKMCSKKENTLPQRLSLLYAKFQDEHKDDVEKMKKDFLQNNGVFVRTSDASVLRPDVAGCGDLLIFGFAS